MSNVHYLPGANIPAATVLDAAKDVDGQPLDTCLVIGKTQSGTLYFAGTSDNAGEVHLLLTRALFFLQRLIHEQLDR